MSYHTLILDDEPISLKFMTKILEGFDKSYDLKLYPCKNAQEAMTVIASCTLDLVLSDVKMPEMDGVSLLAKFRAEEASTLFIMVSAFANKAVALDSLRLGAFDFIEKPVQKDQLVSAVKRALGVIKLKR